MSRMAFGVTVFVVSITLFGIIAENVVSGDTLTVTDVQVAEWLHAHSIPALTQCMLILTHLHDPITISLMTVLLAYYLVWKKRWYELLSVMLILPAGMLLNLFVKYSFHRARPSFEQPLIMLTSYSFPSGHVVATTLFYGAIATLLISQTSTRNQTIFILLTGFLMVVLVAFSRLYLGAHYLTDVLAAYFEAMAWLAFCVTLIHVIQNKQKTNATNFS